MRKLLLVLTAVLLLMTAACARPGGTPAVGVTPPAPATDVTPVSPAPVSDVTPPPNPQPPAKPTESLVAIYRLSDLLSGRKEPAKTWRIPDPVNGLVLAPDGETALLFAQDPQVPGPPPHLRHLPSGRTMRLAGPSADDWFAFGGWIPDGRFVLGGKEIWVADIAAPEIWMTDHVSRELRSIAKPGLTWIVKPSPRGGHLALWNPGGQIELVDLSSGQIDMLKHPFRRGAQDGAVGVAWSPDGKLLAGSDFPFENRHSVSIRIIDAGSREQVREIEGLALMDWLPDNNLLALRLGAEPEAVDWLLITPEGKTVRELKGGDYFPVPGGRYLLHSAHHDGQTSYTLIEITTGKRSPIPLPGWPRAWTAAGDPILITQAK